MDEQLREAVEFLKSRKEIGVTCIADQPKLEDSFNLILDLAQSYLNLSGKVPGEAGEWRNEFQYLLDRKILSRDELAYLFGQIKLLRDQARHDCLLACSGIIRNLIASVIRTGVIGEVGKC